MGIGLSQFKDIRKQCLSQLIIFLCHKYPRVRKATAEQMYTMMLTFDCDLEEKKVDEISHLLTNVNWNDEVAVVKPKRSEICQLLGVRIPVVKNQSKTALSNTSAKIDDLD